ncbi:hypothetical protein GCM10027058_24140 [Microbacterium neimengense]
MSDTPSSRREAREAAERERANAPETASAAQSTPSTPEPIFRPPAEPAPVAAARPSLDDLFTGEATTDVLGAPPPPPDKRRRRKGGWIALATVVVLVGGVAAGGLWVWNTYEDKIRAVLGWEEPTEFEAGQAHGEATITVVSGDAGPQVSQKMFDAGVTRTANSLYSYMIDNNIAFTFQPGTYKLQQEMTSAAALEALGDPANRMEGRVVLPEGLTVDVSLQRISDGAGVSLDDLTAAVADPSAYGVSASSLEGWLFPATYTIEPGTSATAIIQMMVDRTIQSLDAAGVPADQRERILTIASIIQREARYEADMQKVSRVILNRLDPSNQETFGLLQMDSTAQYGYGELHAGSVSTSEQAQHDDNPWNTYVHPGLPVGPISNPGDVAIDAAMHPADGPWLYFVTVNLDTGETVFTTTYAEHQKYVKQFQQWCSEHPDSGC